MVDFFDTIELCDGEIEEEAEEIIIYERDGSIYEEFEDS